MSAQQRVLERFEKDIERLRLGILASESPFKPDCDKSISANFIIALVYLELAEKQMTVARLNCMKKGGQS